MDQQAFRITGQVQGVGFRYWTLQQARRLGLAGYVRNASDGSVEIWALGPAERLAELHVLLRRGPPAARVAAVEILPPPAEAAPGRFEIRS
jgi:acylphosphatase